MSRIATENQIRGMLGYPSRGQDEEFYRRVAVLLGKDYLGGSLPSEDIRVLLGAINSERKVRAAERAALGREQSLPDYDALIAAKQTDPNWNTIAQVARKLGVDVPGAFGMLYQYGVDIVEVEPDGVRVAQPGKAVRYGVWQINLDVLLATLQDGKSARASESEARFQADMARANKIKADRQAEIDEGIARLEQWDKLRDDLDTLDSEYSQAKRDALIKLNLTYSEHRASWRLARTKARAAVVELKAEKHPLLVVEHDRIDRELYKEQEPLLRQKNQLISDDIHSMAEANPNWEAEQPEAAVLYHQIKELNERRWENDRQLGLAVENLIKEGNRLYRSLMVGLTFKDIRRLDVEARKLYKQQIKDLTEEYKASRPPMVLALSK